MKSQRLFVFQSFITCILILSLAGYTKGQSATSPKLIDPNFATDQQLQAALTTPPALPQGITAKDIVQEIVNGRPYPSMKHLDDLLTRSGLKSAERKTLYGRIFIPLNINAASHEEFFMIPTMTANIERTIIDDRPHQNLSNLDQIGGPTLGGQLRKYLFVPLKLSTATDSDLQGIPGFQETYLPIFTRYRQHRDLDRLLSELKELVGVENEVSRLRLHFTP
jgi:hypothetical protein